MEHKELFNNGSFTHENFDSNKTLSFERKSVDLEPKINRKRENSPDRNKI